MHRALSIHDVSLHTMWHSASLLMLQYSGTVHKAELVGNSKPESGTREDEASVLISRSRANSVYRRLPLRSKAAIAPDSGKLRVDYLCHKRALMWRDSVWRTRKQLPLRIEYIHTLLTDLTCPHVPNCSVLLCTSEYVYDPTPFKATIQDNRLCKPWSQFIT
jgi:hypothetical protein